MSKQRRSTPPKGQFDLKGFPGTSEHRKARRALIAKAQSSVLGLKLGDGIIHRVAYKPGKRKEVEPLTGGARIVVESLYKLFVRHTGSSHADAISWAIMNVRNVVPSSIIFNLGNGEYGRIDAYALQDGIDYFHASMRYALDFDREENQVTQNIRVQRGHILRNSH